MISSDFKFQIFNLSEIDSTNSYALDLVKTNIVKEGTVFYSKYQLKGKGQQGNVWDSEQGKNLLFSLLLKPRVKVENQFLISQCIALGLKYYLDSLAVGQVEVKWPNDILVNRQKIAGILIENSIEGSLITNSVVGIGFNTNQIEFEPYSRKATSLKLLKGEEFNLNLELSQILIYLKKVFENYQMYGANYIKTHYLESLYGFHKPITLEDEKGQFKGKIADVLNSGILRVWRNGKLSSYDLKQLKFIS